MWKGPEGHRDCCKSECGRVQGHVNGAHRTCSGPVHPWPHEIREVPASDEGGPEVDFRATVEEDGVCVDVTIDFVSPLHDILPPEKAAEPLTRTT